jgi:hypothetical protein
MAYLIFAVRYLMYAFLLTWNRKESINKSKMEKEKYLDVKISEL